MHHAEVSTLSRQGTGPYATHYRQPFAFSAIPYPLARQVVSRLPCPCADKKLVVISDAEHGFFKRQIEQFAYFDEVIPRSELEVRIIRAQLRDEVPTIADRIGLNNAARRYSPFLWVHLERTRKDNTPFAQLAMTDATTMEDLFVAETELDFAWKGVNDQYNWYPLMNALVDYIESNSNTWRRPAGATPAK